MKVLDFGTARANFAEREAKTQALAFGSQGYMAPERMLGEEDTPAADVFSLGVTLYELLTLESFGRIPPRPNKFIAKVEERIAGVPLDGSPEYVEQARETLRLMLAYEPADRPTAAQLVDIFELLAQDSNDMGMRRFCRTMVAEAKAAQPEADSGDPLTGRTVDEDVSAALGMGIAGVPHQSSAPDPSISDAFGAPPPPPSMNLSAPPPPPPPPPQPVAVAPPPVISAPTLMPHDFDDDYAEADDEEGGGGSMKFVLAGGLFLVLGMAAVGLAVVVALGMYSISGDGPSVDTQVVDTEKPPDTPPANGVQGGKILSEDTRSNPPRSKSTILAYSDAAGAMFTLKGGVGFKAEWDGKAPFDLGALPEGSYRVTVTPAGAPKIRNKTFTVEQSKECNYTFDLGEKDWTGGCK
jgi:hypothetical protein